MLFRSDVGQDHPLDRVTAYLQARLTDGPAGSAQVSHLRAAVGAAVQAASPQHGGAASLFGALL